MRKARREHDITSTKPINGGSCLEQSKKLSAGCTKPRDQQKAMYTRVSIGAPLARLGSTPPTQGLVLVHRWHRSPVSCQYRDQYWCTAGSARQYPANTEGQVSTIIEYIYKSSYRKDNKKEANRSKNITTTTMITTLD